MGIEILKYNKLTSIDTIVKHLNASLKFNKKIKEKNIKKLEEFYI